MKKSIVLILLILLTSCNKAQPPSLSDFSFLDVGMTYDEIVSNAGDADRDIGSGIHLFVYELDDGSELMLSFISLDSLQAVYRYVPEADDCIRLLGDAVGHACMLRLDVEFGQSNFEAGDDIPIKLILTNTGVDDLIIKKRMAPNLPFSPEPFRDITFTITSPSGKDVMPYVFINVPPPCDQDFDILEDGSSLERVIYLEGFYDFDESGEYTVQATYLNVSDPGDGRIAWKGQIVSEIVLFSVTSGSD